jgi:hypothetical protein
MSGRTRRRFSPPRTWRACTAACDATVQRCLPDVPPKDLISWGTIDGGRLPGSAFAPTHFPSRRVISNESHSLW